MMTYGRVRMSSITLGKHREGIDWNKVARYRRALRRGDTFPPISVQKLLRSCYLVHDGYHRFHAHRLEGRKTIQIFVTIQSMSPQTVREQFGIKTPRTRT